MNTFRSGPRILTRPLLATAALLLIPLVAMQFTPEVQWTFSDFVFATALILAVAIPLELVVQRTHGAYRIAATLSLVTAFLLTWVNAAVGITDSPADALYPLVVLLGGIGAAVVRFRPEGLFRVIAGMVLLLGLIGGGALLAGVVPPHNSVLRLFAIHAFFAVPLLGAALLFHPAGERGNPRPSAVTHAENE